QNENCTNPCHIAELPSNTERIGDVSLSLLVITLLPQDPGQGIYLKKHNAPEVSGWAGIFQSRSPNTRQYGPLACEIVVCGQRRQNLEQNIGPRRSLTPICERYKMPSVVFQRRSIRLVPLGRGVRTRQIHQSRDPALPQLPLQLGPRRQLLQHVALRQRQQEE